MTKDTPPLRTATSENATDHITWMVWTKGVVGRVRAGALTVQREAGDGAVDGVDADLDEPGEGGA